MALAASLAASGCAATTRDAKPLSDTRVTKQAIVAHNGNDDLRPFDETRTAALDVDAALASAAINGKRVALILGGNWCHDSRGLAAKLENAKLKKIIEESYELVYVDIGHRDRNLHVPARFGIHQIHGTPTIMILSKDGALLNADSAHDWRNADSRSLEETIAYFRSFAAP